MRYYEFKIVESLLLEYSREITANKMGSKILSALPKDPRFLSKLNGLSLSDDEKIDEVLGRLEKMDPTDNKQFVQWLVKNYGQFKIEDERNVKSKLEKFVQLKNQIKRANYSVDINSYNYSDFANMIDTITSVELGRTTGKQPLGYKNVDDIEILYSGPYGKLLVPTSRKSSCEIGRGTKWCTAARKDNRFLDYTKKDYPGSKLYIWIDKSGDKYQFHFESNEFMDSSNVRIKDSLMKKFVNEHPVLKKFFEKFGTPLVRVRYKTDSSKEDHLEAVNKDASLIRYIKNPDEDIQLAAVQQNGKMIELIKNPSEKVQRTAYASIARLKDDLSVSLEDLQYKMVNDDEENIKYISNPSERVEKLAYDTLAGNYSDEEELKNVSIEELKIKAVKADPYNFEYIKNPSDEVIKAALDKQFNVIKFVKDPSDSLIYYLLNRNPRLILSDYIKNPSEKHRIFAFSKMADIDPTGVKLVDAEMAAVKKNGWNIQWIENPSEEIKFAAVQNRGDSINYIKNPSEQLQIEAVKNAGSSIAVLSIFDKLSKKVQTWAAEEGYTD